MMIADVLLTLAAGLVAAALVVMVALAYLSVADARAVFVRRRAEAMPPPPPPPFELTVSPLGDGSATLLVTMLANSSGTIRVYNSTDDRENVRCVNSGDRYTLRYVFDEDEKT